MESFKIKEKISDLIERYSKEGCYEIRKEKNKIYIYDSSEKHIDFHDGKFISIRGRYELEIMEISQREKLLYNELQRKPLTLVKDMNLF